jgi:hypothetical protein
MSYRATSHWDEKNEIQCLIIFKKLQADNFPRGKQIEYCREISKSAKLSPTNLSAKVSNYKSVSGVNNKSNASINTIELYNKYKNYSVQELKNLIGQ